LEYPASESFEKNRATGGDTMKKKSLEIRWQPARGRLPKWTWAGHGVCIARAMDRDGEPLAAFVEGFGWLHGYTNQVVVHFDPKLMPPRQATVRSVQGGGRIEHPIQKPCVFGNCAGLLNRGEWLKSPYQLGKRSKPKRRARPFLIVLS
jgi:hypothetical protein